MTSNDRAEDRSTRAPAPETRRRAPLGPPHDAYATVGLTVASAAALFFNGRVRAEADVAQPRSTRRTSRRVCSVTR